LEYEKYTLHSAVSGVIVYPQVERGHTRGIDWAYKKYVYGNGVTIR